MGWDEKHPKRALVLTYPWNEYNENIQLLCLVTLNLRQNSRKGYEDVAHLILASLTSNIFVSKTHSTFTKRILKLLLRPILSKELTTSVEQEFNATFILKYRPLNKKLSYLSYLKGYYRFSTKKH